MRIMENIDLVSKQQVIKEYGHYFDGTGIIVERFGDPETRSETVALAGHFAKALELLDAQYKSVEDQIVDLTSSTIKALASRGLVKELQEKQACFSRELYELKEQVNVLYQPNTDYHVPLNRLFKSGFVYAFSFEKNTFRLLISVVNIDKVVIQSCGEDQLIPSYCVEIDGVSGVVRHEADGFIFDVQGNNEHGIYVFGDRETAESRLKEEIQSRMALLAEEREYFYVQEEHESGASEGGAA